MSKLSARQTTGTTNDNGDFIYYDEHDSFWYTKTGQIVRWSVFLGIFLLFALYLGIGYWHAKRRASKGLAPLGYHGWMLNRRRRGTSEQNYQNPHVTYNPYPNPHEQYGMGPMPPPMYDPNSAMPPSYQPPAGGTKIAPNQFTTTMPLNREPSPEYEAPMGPPPAATVRPNPTGASNNPFIGEGDYGAGVKMR
ncbi:hypothetical protein BJ878DRAFT_273611 [Calycina marina]|uniref:Uncharacterized protein n=1 Tax=Calycina marina TaxID=1763456 RepID=A0A9P7YVG1_9HELO|nr:hypothetical protein BJ878DRAFT_273611 [Calycina marina]